LVTILKPDKIKLIEGLLKIDNKEGAVVQFKLNRAQRYFQENKTNRNIIIKARQLGLSSCILADMFTDAIFIPYSRSAVISHESEATKRLLDRVQSYYELMEDPKPVMGIESRNEKSFPELHSSIYLGTAGSKAFGRGDTIRKVHASEIAHWEDGERLLTGLEDSVPMSGELTIETTPNGEENIAYLLWTKAREGKSPYKPFFFPWWWADDYQIPEGSALSLPEDRGTLHLTAEESELVEKNHLTEEQIRWRRWKISEKGGLFWQEFPEDELSCFISIGDPVFDSAILSNLSQGCYEGKKHKGGWTIWQPPEPKMLYTVGADTSAGAPGGSYSAACVLNARWEVVATYQARVEPHIFAGILQEMGKFYNFAELAIERNFTGYAVLGHLLNYPNIYHQRDFVTGKITTNRGWWTSDQTRQYMITSTKENLNLVHCWDLNLIRQLRSFRFIKYEAVAQSFDDLALAFMISMAVRRISGASRGYQGSIKGWSW
jgi:hypothetical protein